MNRMTILNSAVLALAPLTATAEAQLIAEHAWWQTHMHIAADGDDFCTLSTIDEDGSSSLMIFAEEGQNRFWAKVESDRMHFPAGQDETPVLVFANIALYYEVLAHTTQDALWVRNIEPGLIEDAKTEPSITFMWPDGEAVFSTKGYDKTLAVLIACRDSL